MNRVLFRSVAPVALLVAGLAWLPDRLTPFAVVMGQSTPKPSTKNGEWPVYTADISGSRYSPLDQIDATNFNKLEVAWRFKTDNLGPRPESRLEGTPIMVGGNVYATGGTRKAVVCLDARTGELKWIYSMDEGARAAAAPRQLSGRGLSYWTDGRGDERIAFVTIGYRLVMLNAKTGQPVPTFGDKGVIDLKVGVVIGKDKQIDLEKGEIGYHSTPFIVNDTIIVGSSFLDGQRYNFSTGAKGVVRAFDIKTGKQIWRFNTIPYPGEFGNDTWEDGSWEWTGNTGMWTEMTADPVAGLVYLPIEAPTIDFYGGNRHGDNLFAECIVAVDIKTGQRKWFFQLVHHPIWDNDISAAPLLIDAVIDGTPRKLIAQPTKQSFLYVFDRLTGKPIWPMPETPVPQTNVPGEKTSPTQPMPSKPPRYSRNFLGPDDVIDFTPELRAQALKNLSQFRWEYSPFVPGSAKGSINVGNNGGGVNWPGSSFDPETGIAYVQANNSGVSTTTISDAYLAVINPQTQKANRIPAWEAPKSAAAPVGGPAGGLTDGLEGLPIAKPPYGVLNAIDLNNGTMKWQVPHGDTPDAVRTALEKLGVSYPGKTGQAGSVAPMVTKTLVIVGDPQVTAPPGRPRGAMLRAYDKQTGKEVGAVLAPASIVGSPMTYSVGGRQFIIIAVSGGNYTGEYIAYALPQQQR